MRLKSSEEIDCTVNVCVLVMSAASMVSGHFKRSAIVAEERPAPSWITTEVGAGKIFKINESLLNVTTARFKLDVQYSTRSLPSTD